MAFITERVENTLANLIQENNINELYPTEIEIKMHMSEILDALSFFHNDNKMCHLGISPENIYITSSGK